jgi:hypothetical protein
MNHNTPPTQFIPGVAAVPGAPNSYDQVPGHTISDYKPAGVADADPWHTAPTPGYVGLEQTWPVSALRAHQERAAGHETFQVGDPVVVQRNTYPGVYQVWSVEEDPQTHNLQVARGELIKSLRPATAQQLARRQRDGLLPPEPGQEIFGNRPTAELTAWAGRVAEWTAAVAPPTGETRELQTDAELAYLPYRTGQKVAVARTGKTQHETDWSVQSISQTGEGQLYATVRKDNLEPDPATGRLVEAEKKIQLDHLAFWQYQQQSYDDTMAAWAAGDARR